ncbi:MAG: Gfo/Idh/MocA family oxidoreductase [Clostridia bacterium]|nr:Gfo/Idh/MocA family oxidoreductase [Clostridia bacterium]
MEKVRFGIIGAGNQGSYYAGLFKQGLIENGVLTAVADNNPQKIEFFKKSHAKLNATCFSDYKEMLNSGLCDAVLVETPHYDHPEMVIESLKLGIHALCDKPAGVYTRQVREMNEYAKTSNAKFGMIFNQRTNCVYRKMREIVLSGGIGELQRVNWIITDWFRTDAYYKSGGWRATWAGEGGGVLINQCPHQIDLVQWIVGEMPKSVRGFCQYGRWHDIEVEDEVTAYFTYKNGATGVFITTTGETPGTNRFEISGTKGKLLCEGDKLLWYKNKEDSKDFLKTATNGFAKPEVEIIEVETDGKNLQHVGIINNFANSILGLEQQFVDGADGFNGVELMNAIELSGWYNGTEIVLPVSEDDYLKELNKRRSKSQIREDVVDIVEDTSNSFGDGK